MSNFIKDGRLVMWLFVAFIIIVPIKYILELQEGYNHYRNLSETQDLEIQKQQRIIDELQIMNTMMYRYIVTPTESPVHKGPQIYKGPL